jgi:hypothetical protein
MKKIFIYSLISLFIFQNAFAQEVGVLDFKLKLGQHEFLFPYLFTGDAPPHEGYLLSVADMALLKVEFDSFEEILNENLNFLKKECKTSLTRCQEDSNERWNKVNTENENLKQKLELKTELYEDQKTKTLIYSFSSVLITGLASFAIIKVFY